ncbi:MAG: serine hydrolase domain-containing protein [Bacteroidota bacterium]
MLATLLCCLLSFTGSNKLELHQPVANFIRAGQSQEYELSAKAKEMTLLQIERGSFAAAEEMNLLVSVYGPDEQLLEEINTANDASLALFVPRVTGRHRVVISRWNGAAAGNYQITLALQHTGTAIERATALLDFMYDDQLPGAAVGWLQSGQVTFEKTKGMALLGQQQPVHPTAPFDLASLSKMFTAYGIAILQEQGKIRATDKLRDFIPEFPAYAEDITIHHLVHHLSGVKEYEPALALVGYTDQSRDMLSQARILRTLLRHKATYFAPGTDYRYSNAGYFLLAEIISRVTDTPYAEWMQQEIFLPLGMTDTYVYQADRSVPEQVLRSYRKEDGAYDSIRVHPSAYKWQPRNLVAPGTSGIISTLRDMLLWADNYSTRKLGGDAVGDIIRQGIIPEEQAWDWWYGFQRYKYRGQEVFYSEGLTQGYRTVFAHFPALAASLVYLANDGEWRTYYLARKVMDILLEDQLPAGTLTSARETTPPSVANETPQSTVVPTVTQDLVGIYVCPTYGASLEVVWQDDRLNLRSLQHGIIPLQPKTDEVFTTDHWFYDELRFTKSSSGQVTQVAVRNARDGDTFLFSPSGQIRE